MLKLGHSPVLGRLIRQDEPVEELGISTYKRVDEALVAGDGEQACRLVRYMVEEYITIYRFMIEWIDDLSSFLGERGDPVAFERTHELARRRTLEPRREFLARSSPDLVDAWMGHLDRLRTRTEDPRSLAQGAASTFESAARLGAPDAPGLLEKIWLEYLIPHDFVVAWAHELVASIAAACGEEGVPEALSRTWELRWKARYRKWHQMTPVERLQLSVEGMRGHLSGKSRRGDILVWEEPLRYVISLDPCGSGGMLRTGDLVSGIGPYPGGGVNRAPHEWTWNRTGIPWYSTHCPIVMEMLSQRDWGFPMRPVEFPEERDGPCCWFIYKDPVHGLRAA